MANHNQRVSPCSQTTHSSNSTGYSNNITVNSNVDNSNGNVSSSCSSRSTSISSQRITNKGPLYHRPGTPFEPKQPLSQSHLPEHQSQSQQKQQQQQPKPPRSNTSKARGAGRGASPVTGVGRDGSQRQQRTSVVQPMSLSPATISVGSSHSSCQLPQQHPEIKEQRNLGLGRMDLELTQHQQLSQQKQQSHNHPPFPSAVSSATSTPSVITGPQPISNWLPPRSPSMTSSTTRGSGGSRRDEKHHQLVNALEEEVRLTRKYLRKIKLLKEGGNSGEASVVIANHPDAVAQTKEMTREGSFRSITSNDNGGSISSPNSISYYNHYNRWNATGFRGDEPTFIPIRSAKINESDPTASSTVDPTASSTVDSTAPASDVPTTNSTTTEAQMNPQRLIQGKESKEAKGQDAESLFPPEPFPPEAFTAAFAQPSSSASTSSTEISSSVSASSSMSESASPVLNTRVGDRSPTPKLGHVDLQATATNETVKGRGSPGSRAVPQTDERVELPRSAERATISGKNKIRIASPKSEKGGGNQRARSPSAITEETSTGKVQIIYKDPKKKSTGTDAKKALTVPPLNIESLTTTVSTTPSLPPASSKQTQGRRTTTPQKKRKATRLPPTAPTTVAGDVAKNATAVSTALPGADSPAVVAVAHRKGKKGHKERRPEFDGDFPDDEVKEDKYRGREGQQRQKGNRLAPTTHAVLVDSYPLERKDAKKRKEARFRILVEQSHSPDSSADTARGVAETTPAHELETPDHPSLPLPPQQNAGMPSPESSSSTSDDAMNDLGRAGVSETADAAGCAPAGGKLPKLNLQMLPSFLTGQCLPMVQSASACGVGGGQGGVNTGRTAMYEVDGQGCKINSLWSTPPAPPQQIPVGYQFQSSNSMQEHVLKLQEELVRLQRMATATGSSAGSAHCETCNDDGEYERNGVDKSGAGEQQSFEGHTRSSRRNKSGVREQETFENNTRGAAGAAMGPDLDDVHNENKLSGDVANSRRHLEGVGNKSKNSEELVNKSKPTITTPSAPPITQTKTASTASVSGSSSSSSSKKGVRFALPLVTKVKHRPYTDPADIHKLFFQEEELDEYEYDRETTIGDQFECIISHHVSHTSVSHPASQQQARHEQKQGSSDENNQGEPQQPQPPVQHRRRTRAAISVSVAYKNKDLKRMQTTPAKHYTNNDSGNGKAAGDHPNIMLSPSDLSALAE